MQESIEPYRDLNLPERFEEVEAEAQEVAEQTWNEQMAGHREELEDITQHVQAIVVRYQDRLARMNAALQAELTPIQARVEALRHEVEMMRFRAELPERPDAEMNIADEESGSLMGRGPT